MASAESFPNVSLMLQFLAENRWIFDFKLTRFFQDKVWENIPPEWFEILGSVSSKQLSGLPFGRFEVLWPQSLMDFISLAVRLSSLTREGTHCLAESPGHCCHCRTRNVKTDSRYQSNEYLSKSSVLEGRSQSASVTENKMTENEPHCSTENSVVKCGLDETVSTKKLQDALKTAQLAENRSHNCLLTHEQDLHPELPSLKLSGLKSLKPSALRPDIRSGMSEKKLHEVCQMSSLVDHVSRATGSHAIVDVGSGLGYLGQVLHYQFGHRVLGLEGKQGHTTGADRRNLKAASCPELQNVTCEISSDKQSQQDFLALVTDWFNDVQSKECVCQTGETEAGFREVNDKRLSESTRNVRGQTTSKTVSEGAYLGADMRLCMVGLHCCGDLTPAMLQYFVELDCINSLCCVSCCYHRMAFDEDGQQFINFPLSKRLTDAVDRIRSEHPSFQFSLYCLRLAAQETRMRWLHQTDEDHEFHVRNVAYRGLLETCLAKGTPKFQMKKCVRRLAHKNDYASFQTYIEAVWKHIQPWDNVSSEMQKKQFQQEMEESYQAYHFAFRFIEPLTALQYLLQPVIESLIYMDRKWWLEEHGCTAHIVSVFDELVSPRNLALIATKK